MSGQDALSTPALGAPAGIAAAVKREMLDDKAFVVMLLETNKSFKDDDTTKISPHRFSVSSGIPCFPYTRDGAVHRHFAGKYFFF